MVSIQDDQIWTGSTSTVDIVDIASSLSDQFSLSDNDDVSRTSKTTRCSHRDLITAVAMDIEWAKDGLTMVSYI